MGELHSAWTFLLGIAVITACNVTLLGIFRIGIRWDPLLGIARATVQLGIIALLLRGIIAAPWALIFFLALMVTTAVHTSYKHARGVYKSLTATIVAIIAGSSLAVTALFALGVVEFSVQYLIAVAGSAIGGTMTIVTLVTRSFRSQVKHRTGEVEGWLALGATPSLAYQEIAKDAIKDALTPNIDQTKATGLVTLPGTFVGALLGGASPLLAAQLQIAVLAGLMLSGTIASLIYISIITRSPQLPTLATSH